MTCAGQHTTQRVVGIATILLALLVPRSASCQTPASTTVIPNPGAPKNLVAEQESLTVQELIRLPEKQLAKLDVVTLNLVVARVLEPDIDIASYRRFIDRMAEYVRLQIEANEPYFLEHQWDFQGRKEKWICTLMWQIITQDFGYGYLKGKLLDLDHTQPWQKFVHGIIQRGEGTCCNLPVLYVSIGRRLGYPIRMALGPQHAYCRWESTDAEPFNFEVINRKGIWFPTDEQVLAAKINRCPASWQRHFFRSLNAREMLGYFLTLRADVYHATKQFPRAVVDLHQARDCFPNNPGIEQNLFVNVRVQKRDPQARLDPEEAAREGRLMISTPTRVLYNESEFRKPDREE